MSGNDVVVRLRGGLGNQMFQYATALAIAERHGREVRLDLREALPGRGQPHLLRWQVPALQMGREHAWSYPRPALVLARRLRWFARMWRCYAEVGLRFEPAVRRQRPPLHLHGYFQCERYFADVRDALRRQFRPRAAPGASTRCWVERITDVGDSVAIHVRRGDLLRPQHQAVHGVCDAGYYEAAANLVAERTGARSFYVFSDDIRWARATLRLPGATAYVEGHDDAPEWDLHLMSLCAHHVCANSSFSWWGAWLGSHPAQTVVAPRRWFASPQLDAGDIVPARWLRL
jgi:hypothetical protein